MKNSGLLQLQNSGLLSEKPSMASAGISEDHRARSSSDYDRAREVKAFDDTKAGVKGLVDSGVVKIPRIFIHPPEDLSDNSDSGGVHLKVPVVDLEGVHSYRRKEIVDQIRRASDTWGFFQVINHGMAASITDKMIAGVRRFHEQPTELKMEFYTRDRDKKVSFSSNFDLYQSRAANWRDTLFLWMPPEGVRAEELPIVCREIMIEYTKQAMRLAETLFQILSEGLGLSPDHLKNMELHKELSIASHYYPACPEPKLTLGTTKHSDHSFITILLQDQMGGLQVLHQQQWVDVPPLHGALVVNIGDLLQLISNDKFKSVDHRVLANVIGPRVSVACFFRHQNHQSSACYGPIKELLSVDNPPLYKEIQVPEFISHYHSKGLDGTSALIPFRL